MKIAIKILSIIFVSLLLSACNQNVGRTNNVEIIISDSDKFSKEKIEEAIGCVMEKFADFQGCDLLQLWYDEARSISEIDMIVKSGTGRVNGVSKENIIILFSNFYVGSSAPRYFNRNFTYTDWMWILIKNNENENWRVVDWGY